MMETFDPLIPNEARRHLTEMQIGLGPEYFDHIWKKRHQERREGQPSALCKSRSTGTWPKENGPQEALEPLTAAKPIRLNIASFRPKPKISADK